MARVLLVEDDAAVAASIAALLEGLGHQVQALPSAELALDEARAHPPELVLLDVNLPGRSGLEILPDLLRLHPAPAVVVMTAEPTAENAIDAMARGAVDHIVKPLDPAALEAVLRRALGSRTPAPSEEPPEVETRLVGSSPAMLELGRRVGALARSDCSVLIRGESGTGKELVARAIHYRSARRAAPFVPVSCAALPETLLEAELFGHERGAFTGAHKAREGRVERAQGGTLFLDEVGELTPQAQAKLLRFLEERTFERVGSGEVRRADVRILAATNAPLEERVEAGEFREDLYYRLDVARVELPALRERLEDIPLLVEQFLAQRRRSGVRLDSATYARLLAHPWPGNVRELRNAVDAALVALGSGVELRPEHLPGPTRAAATTDDALTRAVEARVRAAAGGDPPTDLFDALKAQLERTAISTALEVTGGNQVAATRLLGMNRATLRRKMSDYGLA